MADPRTESPESAPAPSAEELHHDYVRVLDSMSCGVMLVDGEGVVRSLNSMTAELLGLKRSEVINTLFAEAFIARSELDEFNETVLAAIYDNVVGHQRLVHIEVGERTVPISVATSYLRGDTPDERRPDGARKLGVVAVITDMTELEALRAREDALAQDLRSKHTELRDAYRDLEDRNRTLGSLLRKVQLVRIAASAFIIALVVGIGAYLWQGSEPASFTAQAVGTSAEDASRKQSFTVVERAPISSSLLVPTILRPRREAVVTSPMKGVVANVHVEPGQAVSKGDLIVELDVAELRIERRDAEMALLRAQTDLRELEQWDNGVEVSKARRSVTRARIALEAGEESLANDRFLLEQGPRRDHRSASREPPRARWPVEPATAGLDVISQENERMNPKLIAGVAVVLAAGCGGGGSSNVRDHMEAGPPPMPTPQTPQNLGWVENTAGHDLADDWSRGDVARVRMELGADTGQQGEPAGAAQALDTILSSTPQTQSEGAGRLRDALATEREYIGEADGVSFARITGGPADSVHVDVDFQFALTMAREDQARVRRAAKLWARTVNADYAPVVIPQGTEIRHGGPTNASGLSGHTARPITVDDVLIFTMYPDPEGNISSAGIRTHESTRGAHRPRTGTIQLTRRHASSDYVGSHEVGHIFIAPGFSDGYIDKTNGTFTGPNAMEANGGAPVPYRREENGEIDYGHFETCESVVSYCTGERPVAPTAIDLGVMRDTGMDVNDDATIATPELYGYGAWGEYSAWAAGVERRLEAHGEHEPVEDMLRASATTFGVAPASAFDAQPAMGTASWAGALIGVDTGGGTMAPVTGSAALTVDLATMAGSADFDELTIGRAGVNEPFRQTSLSYGIDVNGNGFADGEGRPRRTARTGHINTAEIGRRTER